MNTFTLDLEHVCIHVIYRASQAEYGVRVVVVAPQEYVNRANIERVAEPYARAICS